MQAQSTNRSNNNNNNNAASTATVSGSIGSRPIATPRLQTPSNLLKASSSTLGAKSAFVKTPHHHQQATSNGAGLAYFNGLAKSAGAALGKNDDRFKYANVTPRIRDKKSALNTLKEERLFNSAKIASRNQPAASASALTASKLKPTMMSKTPIVKQRVLGPKPAATLTARTPAPTRSTVQKSELDKKLARTIDCAKSIKRRSINFLNNVRRRQPWQANKTT
jgi:hypothetical protein